MSILRLARFVSAYIPTPDPPPDPPVNTQPIQTEAGEDITTEDGITLTTES